VVRKNPSPTPSACGGQVSPPLRHWRTYATKGEGNPLTLPLSPHSGAREIRGTEERGISLFLPSPRWGEGTDEGVQF